MVRIAIAGGSGEVAREIIDALVIADKHEITVLTRKEQKESIAGVRFRKVDYENQGKLTEALRGTHTVLSFIQILSDPGSKSQKSLIDAAVAAGVKRFAPSEWGSAGTADMPWWAGKEEIRTYLKKVNENGRVIEYTLFQPGMFLNYLAYPQKTAKYTTPLNTMLDFEHCRAIVVDGQADSTFMTFTTVQDLAAVVAKAVDYPAEWPVVGGIRGNRATIAWILDLGHKIRGRPFAVDTVQLKDLEDGKLKTSWSLEARHPSYTGEDVEGVLRAVLIGTLLSSAKGCWDISDEFNQLFPEFKYTSIEDFLANAWGSKP